MGTRIAPFPPSETGVATACHAWYSPQANLSRPSTIESSNDGRTSRHRSACVYRTTTYLSHASRSNRFHQLRARAAYMPDRRLGLQLLALAAVLPSCGGCLTPYCVPHIERTPTVQVDANADVRAFRINEVARRKDFISLRPPSSVRIGLREMVPDQEGHLPTQRSISLSHGLGLLGKLVFIGDGRFVRNDMSVVLYEPGFEHIRIRPGERTPAVIWKPVPLLEDQVRELDWTCYVSATPQREYGLMPGSASPKHRDALLFFAGEYERLAELVGRDALQASVRASSAESTPSPLQLP